MRSSTQQVAYLFDVDGVLSDPVEKKVIEQDLFGQLQELLQQGNPVGLNTGRSTSWMLERIIHPFIASLDNKATLINFIAIGEKGGTWITFDSLGKMTHGEDTALAVPQAVKKAIKNLVKDKYSDAMFFDETKELMVSVEMHDKFSIQEYHERQKEFVTDAKQILKETNSEESFKIDPSTISTDIEEKHAGKALGAHLFLAWLERRGVVPEAFETFGDSPSDFAMSDELYRRGKSVTMIYVGDKKKVGEVTEQYPVVFIDGYSRGTLAHLTASAKG